MKDPAEIHCQNGHADICLAARRDGITCPHDSCDIDDGVVILDHPTISQRNPVGRDALLELGDDVRLTPEHYLAVRSDGLSFMTCVEAAAGIPELVAQVDRLYGTNLLRRQSPIVNMIDDATGKADEDKQTFLRFVWNCVFIRCAPISSSNDQVEARP